MQPHEASKNRVSSCSRASRPQSGTVHDTMLRFLLSRTLLGVLVAGHFLLVIARPMEFGDDNEKWRDALNKILNDPSPPTSSQSARPDSELGHLGLTSASASDDRHLLTEAPLWSDEENEASRYGHIGQIASPGEAGHVWGNSHQSFEASLWGHTDLLRSMSDVVDGIQRQHFRAEPSTSGSSLYESRGSQIDQTSPSSESVFTSALYLTHANEAGTAKGTVIPVDHALRSDSSVQPHVLTPPTSEAQDSHDDAQGHGADVDTLQASTKRYSTMIGPGEQIPASKFLDFHPLLKVTRRNGRRSDALKIVPEMSLEATALKILVNEQLFGNKLQWRLKSDNLFYYGSMDEQFRRFVSRLNDRRSFFTAQVQQSSLQREVIIAPHPSYARGNVMFDPEPGTKQLLLSVWTQSQDKRRARLQYVGTAALTADDATAVLEQAIALQHANAHVLMLEKDLPHQVAKVMPPRMNTVRYGPNVDVGFYTTSHEWLDDFPLVEHVHQAIARRPSLGSVDLIIKLHTEADQVKQAASGALFGKALWQDLPKEEKSNSATRTLTGIFGSHRRSKDVYLFKADVARFLPYDMALVPYQIHDSKARLFDASVKDYSHAFTLWARESASAGQKLARYYFVSGGSVSKSETKDILLQANSVMERLKAPVSHGI